MCLWQCFHYCCMPKPWDIIVQKSLGPTWFYTIFANFALQYFFVFVKTVQLRFYSPTKAKSYEQIGPILIIIGPSTVLAICANPILQTFFVMRHHRFRNYVQMGECPSSLSPKIESLIQNTHTLREATPKLSPGSKGHCPNRGRVSTLARMV